MTERPNDELSPSVHGLDADDGGPQLAPAARRRRTSNPPHVTKFFDRFHEPLRKVGTEYNIDPKLILALAALESGWFQDDPTRGSRARTRNNLFGYSKDGKRTMNFPDVEENIRQWKNLWGPILRDVGDDADRFVDRLLRPPINPRTGQPAYPAYNSEPDYEPKLRGLIRTINNRLPIWNLDRYENSILQPAEKAVER